MAGISMLWWARTGKLLQFIGGLVVVLDLIGPQRIGHITRQTSRKSRMIAAALKPSKMNLAFTLLGIALTVTLYVYATITPLPRSKTDLYLFLALSGAIFIAGFLLRFADKLSRPIIKLLEANSATHQLRWTAFAVICAGFHLDLLTS
ncbi:hypothetical protein [Lentzea flaviverrucosa]|uniref:hypothetical protein n=1 Tax=Lentzea flaviverrucosa TaxID=200379 RepID=UPI0011603536|nr:hypothetical protein [Lentzea flaviverrucosa]